LGGTPFYPRSAKEVNFSHLLLLLSRTQVNDIKVFYFFPPPDGSFLADWRRARSSPAFALFLIFKSPPPPETFCCGTSSSVHFTGLSDLCFIFYPKFFRIGHFRPSRPLFFPPAVCSLSLRFSGETRSMVHIFPFDRSPAFFFLGISHLVLSRNIFSLSSFMPLLPAPCTAPVLAFFKLNSSLDHLRCPHGVFLITSFLRDVFFRDLGLARAYYFCLSLGNVASSIPCRSLLFFLSFFVGEHLILDLVPSDAYLMTGSQSFP